MSIPVQSVTDENYARYLANAPKKSEKKTIVEFTHTDLCNGFSYNHSFGGRQDKFGIVKDKDGNEISRIYSNFHRLTL
jgi:hypothetical protein